MPINIQLKSFTVKSTPVPADIIYMADSANNFDEVQCTLSSVIAALPAGLNWFGISGTTQAAAVDSGYVIQNASQTTITLPAIAPLGSVIAVRGLGAAGWILQANTGQTIKVDGQTTSSAGSLTSAGRYDSIDITCVVANTTFIASSVLSTGLTFA
jgi:hypothetical protein